MCSGSAEIVNPKNISLRVSAAICNARAAVVRTTASHQLRPLHTTSYAFNAWVVPLRRNSIRSGSLGVRVNRALRKEVVAIRYGVCLRASSCPGSLHCPFLTDALLHRHDRPSRIGLIGVLPRQDAGTRDGRSVSKTVDQQARSCRSSRRHCDVGSICVFHGSAWRDCCLRRFYAAKEQNQQDSSPAGAGGPLNQTTTSFPTWSQIYSGNYHCP